MWGEHEGMGWWMALGSVWFLVFWGLVIWGIAKVAGGGSDAGGDRAKPIEIARRRYASGEITKDQFEEIKRELAEA